MAMSKEQPLLLTDLVAHTNQVPARFIRPISDRPHLHEVDKSDTIIPLIDLDGFSGSNLSQIIKEIGQACQTHGFFLLIMAYYYQYNQEKVSSYHAHGQYQNDQESQFLCNNYLVQLRDIGDTAASNGSTNSDCLDQIMARLSSMFEFDPSKPDYHLWNHDTVQPTVDNGNQDYDHASVPRPTSPPSSNKNLGPIVPQAGGKQKDSCPVVSDDFYCGGHLFKAIYSFFVGKIKAM